MDVSQMFSSGSDFAKAADFEGIAQQTVIEEAGTDEYQGDSFVWVKLKDVNAKIRLNKTNGRAMLQFGNSTEDWAGKNVFVTTATGNFDDGRKWTGWRLSAISAAPVNANSGQTPDDAIPF